MILAGLLTTEQAYRSIEWKSVFLVAGMLAMGTAITKTGLATILSKGLLSFLMPASPLTLLGGLLGITILLTQVMNGAAVVAFMAPIAIQTAQSLGADSRSFVMGITLGASMAFITPLGHPVNILIMGPGGYRFRDFVRFGLPLTLILFFIILLLLPVFWPLR